MLPIRCEKLYTPPSSPASLSCSFRDSSPPSSPNTELLSLDLEQDGENGRATRILDPFAGSYRAKRASSPSSQSPNKRRRQLSELEDEISLTNSDAGSLLSPMELDASVWEEAVERAFSTGVRSIDLSYVPLSRYLRFDI